MGDEESKAFIEALRAGDDAAREQLYALYAAYIERLLRRVLGSDPEIDDLVQEVFISAYASADKLRDANALKGWISTIAVYTATARLRKRKVRRFVRFWDPAEMPEGAAPVAGESTMAASSRVYQVLESLSANERVVFTLRFLEGMSLEEVAEATGVSLATVKRRLASAEQSVKEATKGDPVLARWVRGGRFDEEP